MVVDQPFLESMIWDFAPISRQYEVFGGQKIVLPQTPWTVWSDSSFARRVGVSMPYMAGAMANGIAGVDLVSSLAECDMLASYGAAGLTLERVKKDIALIRSRVGAKPFCVNLIHSPSEPKWEMGLVEHLCEQELRLVEASAFMALTLPLIRYRLTGIHKGQDGKVIAPNQIIAKVSRTELAEKFMQPAPEAMIKNCLEMGWISSEQADLARYVPVADMITAEADSGGHTDNRASFSLIPMMSMLRARMQQIHAYRDEILIGAAGGIATPQAVCAAMTMGADYVVTGSINQACVQASTSQAVKQMLAAAQQADMAMAPAADMFEMGIKVQVLKRGTMFPMRAQKLFDAYRSYDAIDQLPDDLKRQFETQFFRQPLEGVWEDTQSYFMERDPDLLERARKNEKLKMALIFRSYLGRASNWANAGEKTRIMDYQVWCGPAMAAFNAWTRGSFMELPENRCAFLLGQNLMAGALALTRANIIKAQGINVSQSSLDLCVRPKTLDDLNAITAVTLNKESKD